ncbi:MAG: hypothetical protein JNM86_06660 [Phycisphaerae bacterium]|nr:hypothetical protein [Phycisphaerae bacterium]
MRSLTRSSRVGLGLTAAALIQCCFTLQAVAQCDLNCDLNPSHYDGLVGRMEIGARLTSSYGEDNETFVCPEDPPTCFLWQTYPTSALSKIRGFSSWVHHVSGENSGGPFNNTLPYISTSSHSVEDPTPFHSAGYDQIGDELFGDYGPSISHCTPSCKSGGGYYGAVARPFVFYSNSDTCATDNPNLIASATASVYLLQQTDTYYHSAGECVASVLRCGAFSQSKIIFDDNLPPTENSCLRVRMRISNDGTSCQAQSIFPPGEFIRAGIIVSTVGGYSKVVTVRINGTNVDSGGLIQVAPSVSLYGYAWEASFPLSEDASSTAKIESGAIITAFAFNDKFLDFNNDGIFTQADIDWLETNVVGNNNPSSPNYCKSEDWIYRANLVPLEQPHYNVTTIDEDEIIDEDDINALQQVLDAGAHSSILGDADGDDVVNCDDWIDPTVEPSLWKNPLTDEDLKLGDDIVYNGIHYKYIEGLDYDRDGVMSTSPYGDRYFHYRNLNRADFNGDGLVDDSDFLIFIEFYNVSAVGGDLDCDSKGPGGTPVADDDDFVIFSNAYSTFLCTHLNCGSPIPMP